MSGFQKQLSGLVLSKRCSQKFCKIYRCFLWVLQNLLLLQLSLFLCFFLLLKMVFFYGCNSYVRNKVDSLTYFLWHSCEFLWNFKEHFFSQNTSSDCFWHLHQLRFPILIMYVINQHQRCEYFIKYLILENQSMCPQ